MKCQPRQEEPEDQREPGGADRKDPGMAGGQTASRQEEQDGEDCGGRDARLMAVQQGRRTPVSPQPQCQPGSENQPVQAHRGKRQGEARIDAMPVAER